MNEAAETDATIERINQIVRDRYREAMDSAARHGLEERPIIFVVDASTSYGEKFARWALKMDLTRLRAEWGGLQPGAAQLASCAKLRERAEDIMRRALPRYADELLGIDEAGIIPAFAILNNYPCILRVPVER